MKTKLIIIFILFSLLHSHAETNSILGGKDTEVYVLDLNSKKTARLDEPIVQFHKTGFVTIDFGTQPVNNFTVTISSPLTDVDYYVTSSFTTIPLAVDGISDYYIIIESCYGDVFEGTLAASEYASNELF